ncbi:MAG: endopeptidase La [Ruminococcaceae bacterium]|nr:endopeptidase La [Oscillospiraceae bacterium]
MSEYIEKADKLALPLIILGGVTAFPAIPINFEISDELSIAAADAANLTDSFVFLLSLKEPVDGEISEEHFYRVGTVAKIKQCVKAPDGTMRVLCEGYARASLSCLRRFADYYSATVICKTVTSPDEGGLRGEALLREARRVLADMTELLPNLTPDMIRAASDIRSPGAFADFVAANILVRPEDKQAVLEVFEPLARLERVIPLIQEETELLRCEMAIHKQVREHLARNQKEFYLREQIRVIEDELGEGGDNEIDEYEQRIRAAGLPEEIEKKLLKENERMSKTPFGSAESSVLRNYLDVCLELPWNQKSKDRLDLVAAERILNADHDGLFKVKERILEFLAVKKLNPELRNQILCLVGPPGVGKTSVAQSIARAMNRKYVRVSLGGVRDEADIRGHRKTYLGAMPGRIIAALTQAGVNNPLILLDEIDKMTRNAQGDPSSALLEVLDGEQNKSFRDHFVELPFDLSDCLFIATANTLEGVPKPLIDRMEIIELHTYTRSEKLRIAERYLFPKQLKRHGLTRRRLRLTVDAIEGIIDDYTREAGVRNLEREIASICRKAARRVAAGEKGLISVKNEDLPSFLGPRKMPREQIGKEDVCGVVNGLAYTEAGGDLLKVEALTFPGEGKIELTGSLGDVMKESARIAVSYIRAHAAELGISSDFYKKLDIHIHFPEGAVPKDGPSAGAAMVTALVSALTGIPVRRHIAMTGEINLTGGVLAIGGLKEKTMAAVAGGVKTVLIPADNQKDLPDLDPDAVTALRIVPCKRLGEVLSLALASGLPRTVKQPEPLPELHIQEIRTVSHQGERYGL